MPDTGRNARRQAPAGLTGAKQSPPVPPTGHVMRTRLAQAVLQTSGVVTLEPALKDALRRLALTAYPGRGVQPRQRITDPADAVRLTVEGAIATAVVDITVSNERCALATAQAAQFAGLQTLRALVPRPTVVSVIINVLGIEPRTPTGT